MLLSINVSQYLARKGQQMINHTFIAVVIYFDMIYQSLRILSNMFIHSACHEEDNHLG
jgi:hypothetical protein